jgi:putative oxidoreductase
MTTMKSFVNTGNEIWIAPARLIIGIFLIMPIGGGISSLIPNCHEAAQGAVLEGNALPLCQLLRGIELIMGICFIFGFLIRAVSLPVVMDLAIRVVSNGGASLLKSTSPIQHIVILRGDWSFGAMYVGAIILAFELFHGGGGAYSVDYWLSRRFGREGKGVRKE